MKRMRSIEFNCRFYVHRHHAPPFFVTAHAGRPELSRDWFTV